MARYYKRKPDAKVEKLTVPLSPDLLERIMAYAQGVAVAKTTAARMLIEAGLKREGRAK